MTENARKIFDILGVEPNEKFKIKYDGKIYDKYYIDKYLKLIVDKENFITSFTTLDIITGNIEIIKIPKYEFTEGEKNALKGLKLLKFNYIARNETGELIAYTDKPEKNYTLSVWQDQFGEITYVNPHMFKSIKWKDSEPFEISDFEDELEYETDKEKIKDQLKTIFRNVFDICTELKCDECNYIHKYNDDKYSNIKCKERMAIDELIKNNFTFLKSEE